MNDEQDMNFRNIQKTVVRNEIDVPNIDRRKSTLRDEPRYNGMHAKNIKITKKGRELAKRAKLVLTTTLVVGGLIVGGVAIKNNVSQNNNADNTTVERVVDFIDTSEDDLSEDDIISVDDVELDNMTIILRRGTSNTNGVVKTAEQELSGLGVNVVSITDSDDLVEQVNNIKSENPDDEVIVINIDGASNKSDTSVVLMTTYSNEYINQSADIVAIAIQNENKDIFGVSSEIKCGKKDLSSGVRVKTSVEKELTEAGLTDVACLTVALSPTLLEDDIKVNNIATSITNSVIRYASLTDEEKEVDYIHRVEYGDTISELAEENGVSSSYIIEKNEDAMDDTGSRLLNNTALIVQKVPTNLTSTKTVDNPLVTTDESEITTTIQHYTVVAGDTLSEIAEKLNVSQSELITESSDVNSINVGDDVSYVTSDKILISTKTDVKTY